MHFTEVKLFRFFENPCRTDLTYFPFSRSPKRQAREVVDLLSGSISLILKSGLWSNFNREVLGKDCFGINPQSFPQA